MIFNFLFISLSCNSSETSQKQPSAITGKFVNIYARYLADQKEWKVEAAVFSADTTMARKGLKIDGDIFFQKYKMSLRHIEGYTPKYLYQGSTTYENTNVVQLVNKKQYKSYFKMDMTPISSYNVDGSIKLTKGFNLDWEGDPLSEEETLIILLSDSAGKTQTMNRLGPSKTNSIEVIPPQLKSVAPGRGTIEVIKKKRKSYKENGVHRGSFILEYYMNPINITIEK